MEFGRAVHHMMIMPWSLAYLRFWEQRDSEHLSINLPSRWRHIPVTLETELVKLNFALRTAKKNLKIVNNNVYISVSYNALSIMKMKLSLINFYHA